MTPEEQAGSDRALFARLNQLNCFRQAENLLLFCGTGSEPRTMDWFDALLVTGKMIYLPRCLAEGRMEFRRYRGREHLELNRWSIPEPSLNCPLIRPQQIEFALIPALCYDRTGQRLGHGGGYYDRFLAEYTGATAGLCRDLLLQQTVPTEPHDQPVDFVLTESLTIPARGKTS